MMTRGFAQVPNIVLCDERLSRSARLLYAILIGLAPESDGTTLATYTQLAERMQEGEPKANGEKQVRRWLNVLYSAGVLERIEMGRSGRPSRFLCTVIVTNSKVVDDRAPSQPDSHVRLEASDEASLAGLPCPARPESDEGSSRTSRPPVAGLPCPVFNTKRDVTNDRTTSTASVGGRTPRETEPIADAQSVEHDEWATVRSDASPASPYDPFGEWS